MSALESEIKLERKSAARLTPRLKKMLRALLIVAVVAGTSYLFDFPAIRDARIPQLNGIQGAENAVFYNRSLGGFLDLEFLDPEFLDQEFLVRMDLHGSDPARMISDLRLHTTEDIPRQFWRISPWYWPKSRRPDMVAYASQNFSPERGEDGFHAFAVHDRRTDRFFLWIKSNF